MVDTYQMYQESSLLYVAQPTGDAGTKELANPPLLFSSTLITITSASLRSTHQINSSNQQQKSKPQLQNVPQKHPRYSHYPRPRH